MVKRLLLASALVFAALAPAGSQTGIGGGVFAPSPAAPYTVAPRPDTVQGFYTLTTTAGSANLTLAGGAFTVRDVGKLIMCTGIGPTEGRLNTSITAVADNTHITTAAPATQAMTAVSQRCIYGTDQAARLQATFTYGATNNIGSYVPGGLYLVGTPLTCLPPAANNSQNAPAPLCQLDGGAMIMAMASMTSVITYGGIAGDYSQYLRGGEIGGGTVDANFLASYAVDIPFYAVVTRSNQTTKNALLGGVRWGNLGAPGASGGNLDFNNKNSRDVTYVTVSGITKAASNPVVTTAWDHGFATGRVVTLVGVAGMTEANGQFFQITVTGARTFTLDNTNSSGWGVFSGTAQVALTMPSMRVPAFVTAITNANPGVVTTAKPHGFSNGQQVWLADMAGINLGGVYTVAGAASTTFQLSGTDTTSLGTWSSGGSAIPYLAPTAVEKCIYHENGIDADVVGGQYSGCRYGVYSNPSTAGYDCKIFKPHFYNYNENGEMFAAVSVGGDCTIESAQVDLPVRYGFQFSGPRNHVIGSRLNYQSGGVLAAYNNYASFIRLESGADVTAIGNGMKGDGTNAILNEVSGALQASADGSSYGAIVGYKRLQNATAFVSFPQPDLLVSAANAPTVFTGAVNVPPSSGSSRTGFLLFRNATDTGMASMGMRGGGAGLWLQSHDWNQASQYPIELNPIGGAVKIGPGGLTSNGTAGVSCPAGITAGTVTVVGGVVTHC